MRQRDDQRAQTTAVWVATTKRALRDATTVRALVGLAGPEPGPMPNGTRIIPAPRIWVRRDGVWMTVSLVPRALVPRPRLHERLVAWALIAYVVLRSCTRNGGTA